MDMFPFEKIREGQREFLEDVKNAVKEGKHLVAHAPTGIGKTAAVISPSLGYALKNNKTIFFLTPKHTQHTIVIDTLRKIKKKFNVDFISVDIIGKQWTCPHKVRDLDSREFNEFCRALKKDERCNYYNNVRGRKLSKKAKDVMDRIKKETMHSEEISDLCSENTLCPYEVCVEVGKDASFIVCDYFHIFSPKVRKAFLSKLNKGLENSILIIDEAHNLPDRVRKLLSHTLTEISLNRAIKEANFLGYEHLSDDFRDVIRILRDIGRGMKRGDEKLLKKEEFVSALTERIEMKYEDFTDTVNDLGGEVLKIPNRHRSYSKAIARFLERWGWGDMGYARIFRRENAYSLNYNCLDPSISSKEIFKEVHSSVFMSGTLVPLKMYADVLDLEPERTILKEYQSPFPKENRLTLLIPGVTTKYSKRSDFMYRKYVDTIARITHDIPGNVAIFFPSYMILETIKAGLERTQGKEILSEKKDMKKDDRIQLYNRLVNSGKKGALLLGVQAGSFSEGLDYANNILDGVIIVGLPLEIPNLETKSLIDYYDFKFERGWDYGYIYPAMNRALQAAGRCIRSETDKGVIVLMDERFRWRNYSKCFPVDFEAITTEMPEKYVRRFFGKKV
jgi:DNA excision repair protein ERCC-2